MYLSDIIDTETTIDEILLPPKGIAVHYGIMLTCSDREINKSPSPKIDK